jgi:hypothetical protein
MAVETEGKLSLLFVICILLIHKGTLKWFKEKLYCGSILLQNQQLGNFVMFTNISVSFAHSGRFQVGGLWD